MHVENIRVVVFDVVEDNRELVGISVNGKRNGGDVFVVVGGIEIGGGSRVVVLVAVVREDVVGLCETIK